MKNLRSQTETSQVSPTNRVDDRISGVEDKVEETVTLVKGNLKSLKIQAQTSRKVGTLWKDQNY